MPTPYELRFRRESVKQPENIQTNEFIEGLFTRRSIRAFDPNRKVSEEQLKYLIAAAQCAPSSSGTGDWSVIALTTDEEKRQFKEAAGPVLNRGDDLNGKVFDDCSVYLIWVMDNYKIQAGIEIVADKEIDKKLLELVHTRRNFQLEQPALENLNWEEGKFFDPDLHSRHLDQSYYGFRALTDATIAAQTFSMCAESIGLATLYMGSLAHCRIHSFKNVLKLPQRTYPVFGMAVGYEIPEGTDPNGRPRGPEYMNWFKKDPGRKLKPIQPQEIVYHQGHYRQELIKPFLREYNKTVEDYTTNIVGRMSDYVTSRATCRSHKCEDHIGFMRYMGNKFE
jgi:FMN reductase (NADPH)